MISFNERDVNMSKISRQAKLFNLVTQYGYRIFGLTQDNNTHIILTAPMELVQGNKTRIDNIVHFFKKHSVTMEVIPIIPPSNDTPQNPIFRLGLRRDLRNYPVFCAATVQTIIYRLEGKLADIDDNFVIPNVPYLNP